MTAKINNQARSLVLSHKSLTNIFKTAVITAALVLSTSVNAAIVTQNFSMTVDNGSFLGSTGYGSFTYDESNIFSDGWSSGGYSITREEGLTIEFTAFGQTFTEDDEIGIGVLDTAVPAIYFNSSLDVLGIDFVISEISYEEGGLFSTVTEISQPGILEIALDADLTLGLGGSYNGIMTITAVPLPAAVWLFGSGLIGLIGIAKRKKA